MVCPLGRTGGVVAYRLTFLKEEGSLKLIVSDGTIKSKSATREEPLKTTQTG